MTYQSINWKIFTKKEQKILIDLEQPSPSGVQTSAPFHLDAICTQNSSTTLTSAGEEEFEMLPAKKKRKKKLVTPLPYQMMKLQIIQENFRDERL